MRSSPLILSLTLAVMAACGPADGSPADLSPTAPPTLSASASASACAAPVPGPSAAPGELLDATESMLGTLDDDQRPALANPGLALATLSTVQRAAALAVLKAGLRQADYDQLAAGGLDGYRIRISGTPSVTGTWTVQLIGAGRVLDLTVGNGVVTTSCHGAAGSSS